MGSSGEFSGSDLASGDDLLDDCTIFWSPPVDGPTKRTMDDLVNVYRFVCTVNYIDIV